jgi:hypothetical protein
MHFDEGVLSLSLPLSLDLPARKAGGSPKANLQFDGLLMDGCTSVYAPHSCVE